MSNTYSQIFLHIVFAVQYRDGLISTKWKEELYKYITGIVTNSGHKMLAINGMPDHVHMLVGFKPADSISKLVQTIKKDSSFWINKNRVVLGKFAWQEGYGVFSYSKSQIPEVSDYIFNQEKHHKVKSFRDEYINLLTKFGVEFDLKYIFKDIEDSEINE